MTWEQKETDGMKDVFFWRTFHKNMSCSLQAIKNFFSLMLMTYTVQYGVAPVIFW